MHRSAKFLLLVGWLTAQLALGCHGPKIRERTRHPSAGAATHRPAVICAEAPDELVFAERRSRVEGSQTVPAEEVLALAELAHGIGCRLRPSDPCTALPWFRDAAAYSAFGLAAAGWGDATAPARARAMAVHNSSVEWLLRCAGSGPSDLNPAWRERLGAAGVQTTTTTQERVGLPCHELWIASDFRVRNLDSVAREGLGVPVIALSRFPDRRQVPDRFLPERLRLPATAVFRPCGPLRGGEWRTQASVLELHDPARETSTLTCDGRSVVPLAADLTTPLAHQFLNSPLNELAWGGLLRPEAYSDVTGIFMSGPYRPGKIPVLFVHGLWSSPGTWLLMANRLQADPFIRDHYQFWYAYYPTGASLMVSAVRIRDTLSQLREAIDPGLADPALDRMVVVGHSLGGVLSKQLLLHSGDELERGLFTRPFESVAMSPESRQSLSRYLFFEPEPSIRRAIFLAAPHRGSNVANFSGSADSWPPPSFGGRQHSHPCTLRSSRLTGETPSSPSSGTGRPVVSTTSNGTARSFRPWRNSRSRPTSRIIRSSLPSSPTPRRDSGPTVS